MNVLFACRFVLFNTVKSSKAVWADYWSWIMVFLNRLKRSFALIFTCDTVWRLLLNISRWACEDVLIQMWLWPDETRRFHVLVADRTWRRRCTAVHKVTRKSRVKCLLVDKTQFHHLWHHGRTFFRSGASMVHIDADLSVKHVKNLPAFEFSAVAWRSQTRSKSISRWRFQYQTSDLPVGLTEHWLLI